MPKQPEFVVAKTRGKKIHTVRFMTYGKVSWDFPILSFNNKRDANNMCAKLQAVIDATNFDNVVKFN